LYPVLLHVLAVIFVATLIRSAFGFGEALIAVPLLALSVPVEIAAPLAALVSITVAAVVVVQDWRNIHFRCAGWLVLCGAMGSGCDSLLLLVSAADPRRDLSGTIRQSSLFGDTFLRYVFVGLIGTGLLLLAQAVRR
jgi:uncharacterized membrane protein YfcA